jgi:adenosylcobinamide-GDP ribazoletransferase
MPGSAIADRPVLRALAASIAFLTRVPLGARVELTAVDVGRGTAFFPLVGAAVGAATAGVTVGFARVLPDFPAAVLAVAFEAGLTGAIHLDALADVGDSIGARSRQHALEAMRDPRIGSFGAAALALALLLKGGALAALLAEDGSIPAVTSAYAVGRTAPLVLGWVLPYAAPGAGSGRALTQGVAAWERLLGILLGLGVCLALTGTRGLVLAGAALAGLLVVGVVSWRRLGGVTGDSLGAAIELATTGALLACVATL